VRSRLPGSDWLYYRLYGSANLVDRALTEQLAPNSESWRRQGLCGQWFYIRYGDPDWHLRWRFQGDPKRLTEELMPQLTHVLQALKEQGWLWGVELGSYEREIERYGGPNAMPLCERWFAQDSRRVSALLALLKGGPDHWRWQTAACCLLRDLADLGFDESEVKDLFTWVAGNFRRALDAVAAIPRIVIAAIAPLDDDVPGDAGDHAAGVQLGVWRYFSGAGLESSPVLVCDPGGDRAAARPSTARTGRRPGAWGLRNLRRGGRRRSTVCGVGCHLVARDDGHPPRLQEPADEHLVALLAEPGSRFWQVQEWHLKTR
jgi:thiopeptide-type bacteriocin biosynthesis protein